MSTADLLTLQGNIKKDADGYKEEFYLQYRHYQALLDIFQLQPSKESRELGELAAFVAQVCKLYPQTTAGFAPGLTALLAEHHMLLEPSLRRSLVQALILLRNRGQLAAIDLMPLLFKMFKCPDKLLRQLVFRHIISDIKSSNKKHRNEKLNRQLQNFLYGVIGDDDEAAAKKALAVCTDLWRRHVWRDARTVNVIANAAYHKSSKVMLAAVKFFLGQDKAEEELEEEGGDQDDGDQASKPSAPSKEDVYKAYNSGTRSSKRKKQAKLKRVMATVKKAERKGAARGSEGFAALHLLHDPQTFAERLFARLQSGNERFETRMALMAVVSRVIGVHKLLVLNFYGFLQKYVAPHTRDVSLVLAALVGAAHELVPPDVMAPVLRQLVDNFVHDRARPEVVTLGIKTTRELCLRCPLIMTQDLLLDLAAYKKFRNKEVSAAARGLIGLYRELQPELLAKKDRGRGADLEAKPAVYGAVKVASRVEGAELLEQALAAGRGSSDDDVDIGSSDEDEDGDGTDSDLESLGDDIASSSEWESVEEGEAGENVEDGEEAQANATESEGVGLAEDGEGGPGQPGTGSDSGDGQADEADEGSEEGASLDEAEGSSGEVESDDDDDDDDDDDEPGAHDSSGEDDEATVRMRRALSGRKQAVVSPKQGAKLKPQEDSIAALKRKLAAAKARKQMEARQSDVPGPGGSGDATHGGSNGVPLEADRILTAEDFERIRRLKHKRLIEDALSKHGLKGASKAKRARLLEAAEAEAEEAEALRDALGSINEVKVDPRALEARKKRGHDKASRLATVLEGREGRGAFGASSGMKKSKTGGLSEREKQRKKAMPVAARLSQLRNRAEKRRQAKGGRKNFKGHVRG